VSTVRMTLPLVCQSSRLRAVQGPSEDAIPETKRGSAPIGPPVQGAPSAHEVVRLYGCSATSAELDQRATYGGGSGLEGKYS